MTSCVSLKQTNYVEFLLCTFCIVLDYTAQWVRTQSEWIHGLCPVAQPQHSPCPRCLLWRRTWQVMLEPWAHPSRCCRGHWEPVVSWCPGSVALPTYYMWQFFTVVFRMRCKKFLLREMDKKVKEIKKCKLSVLKLSWRYKVQHRVYSQYYCNN